MDWRIGDINWWGVVDSRKENGWPSWCSAITLTGTTSDAYFCVESVVWSISFDVFIKSSIEYMDPEAEVVFLPFVAHPPIPRLLVLHTFPRQDCLECPCISVQSSGRSIMQGIRSKNENSVSKIWSYLSYQNIVTYYDDYNSKKKPRVTLINRKTPLTKSPSEWSHCRWQKRTKRTRKTRYCRRCDVKLIRWA